MLLIGTFIVALSPPTVADPNGAPKSVLIAQAPLNYIPWYTPVPSPWPDPWPSPIPSAYAAIDGAFAVGNIYETKSPLGFQHESGFDMFMSGLCNFVCYGIRGVPSHHVWAFGSDYNSVSFTHQGGADNWTAAGISNSIYSVALLVAEGPPVTENHYLALDGNGKVGVYNDIVAGASVIAGAGTSNPYPTPTAAGGSLVSYTGTGTGELRMGSAADYVRCDYGATTTDVLTCNAPLMAAKTTTSTPGPVAPCYGSDGTACGRTFHMVKNPPGASLHITTGTSGCAANSWCSLTSATISLSGAAVFANGSYGCALSSSSSYKLILMVNMQTATNFEIQAYNPGVSIDPNIDLGINYFCSGD